MRDLDVTHRRLSEIHDNIRARFPETPAKSWAELGEMARRIALLFLDIAQHHADVREPWERRISPDELVRAALAAAAALGYCGTATEGAIESPLYRAFAESLLAEVLP